MFATELNYYTNIFEIFIFTPASILGGLIHFKTSKIMQEIIRKLRFKDKGTVLNAPSLLEKEFVKHACLTAFKKNEKSKNTLVFITNQTEFLDFLNNRLVNIEPDSLLWFAYPKGTSKIKTDINRDTIRKTGEEFGITTVAAISINETWSALRFRPIEKVGK